MHIIRRLFARRTRCIVDEKSSNCIVDLGHPICRFRRYVAQHRTKLEFEAQHRLYVLPVELMHCNRKHLRGVLRQRHRQIHICFTATSALRMVGAAVANVQHVRYSRIATLACAAVGGEISPTVPVTERSIRFSPR